MKKKSVGIVTLSGYFNYGNRLQNYAIETVLNSMGFIADTIVIDYGYKKRVLRKNQSFYKKTIYVLKTKKFKIIIQYFLNKIKKMINIFDKIRTKKFKTFSTNFLNERFYKNTDEDMERLNSSYDFFITGSDQVWHPSYLYGKLGYFLLFADNKKRISYAPSFGVSQIPKVHKQEMAQMISDITYLSIREEKGQEIVKNLTEREAKVLIDPTLLLTKNQWLSIIKTSSKKPKGKYIVVCFLGSITSEIKNKIKKIAKENNCAVVSLANKKTKKYYLTDPCEFIDYINDAKLVLTDSFHCSVFSILFETPFLVFNREDKNPCMITRVDTLLTTLKLENLKALKDWHKKNLFEVDYLHVENILEKEREKAMNFLQMALNKNYK